MDKNDLSEERDIADIIDELIMDSDSLFARSTYR